MEGPDNRTNQSGSGTGISVLQDQDLSHRTESSFRIPDSQELGCGLGEQRLVIAKRDSTHSFNQHTWNCRWARKTGQTGQREPLAFPL